MAGIFQTNSIHVFGFSEKPTYLFTSTIDVYMYRNVEFCDILKYSRHKKGAIPATHLYHALYSELPAGS